VGLTDRGTISAGQLADLVIAEFDGPLAVVRQVFRGEEMIADTGELVGVPA
jgi:alpha-D-ribose 1-methylphosphonate 5-triphosphate diphosphatase PhnM